MENVVRVDCLYRVSTIGQVEKNDIPMQREFCRAFIAEHPNWKLNILIGNLKRKCTRKAFPVLRNLQKRETPSRNFSF